MNEMFFMLSSCCWATQNRSHRVTCNMSPIKLVTPDLCFSVFVQRFRPFFCIVSLSVCGKMEAIDWVTRQNRDKICVHFVQGKMTHIILRRGMLFKYVGVDNCSATSILPYDTLLVVNWSFIGFFSHRKRCCCNSND